MLRPLIALTALALPVAAHATPLRHPSLVARGGETLGGHGAWIGAVLVLLAAVGLVLAYSNAPDAPASP